MGSSGVDNVETKIQRALGERGGRNTLRCKGMAFESK